MSLQYQRSTLNSFSLGNWATLLTYESVKAQQSLAKKEKSSFFLPSTLVRICFYSLKPSVQPPQTHETVHVTSLSSLRLRWQCFFSFSFIFILTRYLKNHNKSQNNHKMEYQILLNFT